MTGLTNHEAKLLTVQRVVVDLVAAVTALEGTPYFKLILTVGSGGSYGMEVQKKSTVPRPTKPAA